MKRRDFIRLAGAALTLPVGARAQEPGRTYRLALALPIGRDEQPVVAFLEELRLAGFVEGKNLIIVGGKPVRNAQTAAIVSATLDANPDVILSGGDVVGRAFQNATQSVPLLLMTEDLFAAGFVASMARPEANVTGISLMSPELDGKRQDILIEAVPNALRIAVLADSNVASLRHLQALEASARNQGKEWLAVRAANDGEIVAAVNQANAQGAAALNVLSSPMLQANRNLILDRVAELRLPAIYQWPETAVEGGLLAYGPSFVEIFRQRARMTIRALRGTKPADLPVEQPSVFQLAINLRSAKAIGFSFPVGLELRADRLIE